MIAAALLALGGCVAPAPPPLEPGPNPAAGDPLFATQPWRDHPQDVVAADGIAWVSLPGAPDHPGEELARVELDTGRVRRVRVGRSPVGLALRRADGAVAVFARYEAETTLLDARGRPLGRLPTGTYAVAGDFSPDGGTLWVASRAEDAVQAWRLEERHDGLVGERIADVPVGVNPRDLAVSPDGRTVAVASATDGSVSLIDAAGRVERARVALGAPASGLAWAGEWLVVATLSASTHHQPLDGPDTDADGLPGDSTPNIDFQDLQSELAVLDAEGRLAHRVTSDTICCRDYRDVDPDDLARHGELLPPRATWIVGGALPEQVAAAGDRVWVSYSGSNQLQRFDVDPATGALRAGPIASTGHGPHGVAVDGGAVLVADRLGEALGRHDVDTVERIDAVPVGDGRAAPFPATDAELGELINQVTAPFSVDGDLACTACHRDDGNVDKAFSMPLTARPGVGLRQAMAYRGAADTRPWFFESAMDETNFKPVLNELARVENFCCTDPTLWPEGAPADCATDPPTICATAPNAGSADGQHATRGRGFEAPRPTPFPTRDAFVLDAARRLIGRDESFGDALVAVDPITGARRPRPLDFEGITRALGVFLVTEPRLLPNPNDPEHPAARRGRALFERPDVGCALCHPAPTFAVSTSNNPHGLPLRMGPVVTPHRAADGTDLDALAEGFTTVFPEAESGRFGVPSLRGLWDRAPSMLHHGLARGAREVVCTPGHPALRPGELGFNERDGVPDTHGGTSQLSPAEIDDLVAYLMTL